MITQENFKQLLQSLSFEDDGHILKKQIGRAVLTVDFKQRVIIYPENLTVNEQQTCNFSSDENFVVFECVHRLLEKGYQPEHLELEPRWKLGHGASGGRADILVRDRQGKPLLMIECKTAKGEFEKEKKKMQSNGGQLFSYLAQDRNTQYLCLYASNFDKDIQYNNLIIKIKDRKEDQEAFKEDDTIKLYKNAKSNKELFEVWKETYNLYFNLNGIFEDDVNAYSIELKPLKKKNLKPLDEAQGIFNIFMEILRHNNISDNANAFNRMLSLLLCKIVDEEKGDNEILDFQIKEEEDDAEKIQDRLQKLYAKGMKEHLDEEIVYFEDKVIKDIIKKYPKQTTIDKVEDIFRQIKYYTQNEFALKEVHNKALFEQNAKVLNEVIRMLQNYRFLYTKKQQILGDFFELLLNHGVKQSEGQFFTPVPIVRFIILSLGFDKIIYEKIGNTEKSFLPKILDYACGSGHFLTESIDELQNHIQRLDNDKITDKDQRNSLRKYQAGTEWAKEYIFGIEKDYRLARTSQIACFLNGDGDANIIYGDGLVEHKRLNTTKNPFDVVIANPPYAIKACKNYLQIKPENYQVYDCLTETSGEIETLFVERTAQVLKENGKAGIILPSSILSGDKKPYNKAREILLENFEIKAVAEFGAGTFGATGTNTVVLFLQKRSEDFKKDRQYICDDLFSGVERDKKLEHIDSAALLQKFVNHRRIELSDYQSLLKRQASKNIKQSELWLEYKSAFPNDNDEVFYKKVLVVEASKFYYFMLLLDDKHQSQKTVLVKAGEKDTAKKFIGYEFSNRKGSEGIKIFKDGNNKSSTKLYDDNNHNNPQKANSYILKNFWGEKITAIDENINEHISYANLTDMLDFERKDFNKTITLSPQKNINIETKWELKKLGEIVNTIESGNRPKGGVGNIASGALSLGGEHIHANSGMISLESPKYVPLSFYKNSNKGLLKENDVLLCKDGALTGKIALLRKELNNKKAMVNEHVFILRCNEINKQRYVFNFLLSEDGKNLLYQNITGTAQGGLNLNNLKNIKVPIPPLEVQRQIADECEAVDKKTEQARQTIIANKQQIEDKVQMVVNSGYEIKELGDVIQTQYGYTAQAQNEGKVRYLRITDITDEGKLKDTDKKYINPSEEIKNKYTLKKNDIVIARSGSTGRMLLYKDIKETLIFASYLVRVIATKKILPEYIFSYHKTKNYWEQINALTVTLAQPNLNAEKMKNIKIPVPPLSVQKRLVAQVEKLEAKVTEAQAVIDSAAECKNAILKRHL